MQQKQFRAESGIKSWILKSSKAGAKKGLETMGDRPRVTTSQQTRRQVNTKAEGELYFSKSHDMEGGIPFKIKYGSFRRTRPG